MVDALQRAATSTEIADGDIDAVAHNVAIANGMASDAHHSCSDFNESCLADPANLEHDIVLRSIGPLSGVDRLLEGQELKFALEGVTIVFGDNASGKSGYARVARQLCHARVPVSLRGDVFVPSGNRHDLSVTYTYNERGNDAAVSNVWRPTDPPPDVLRGVTVLDTANAQVYVTDQTEILFLPSEIRCLTRLGQLLVAVQTRFQTEADQLSDALSISFGKHYSPQTVPGMLVAKLTPGVAMEDLPSEASLREAAIWTDDLAAELASTEALIGQGPLATATTLRRVADAVTSVVNHAAVLFRGLTDEAIERDRVLLAQQHAMRQLADDLARSQMSGHPLKITNSDSWRAMYEHARAFAVEAGLHARDEQFAIGDPCPLCQQALDEKAASRLAAFDEFVRGRAIENAAVADRQVVSRLAALRIINPRSSEDVANTLAEFVTFEGGAHAPLATDIQAGISELRDRRELLIQAFEAGRMSEIPTLAPSVVGRATTLTDGFRARADELLAKDDVTATLTARMQTLRDQKTLHSQLDEVIARRTTLVRRHGCVKSVSVLNTGPVSRLATTIRKELVTPELSARISSEIAELEVDHIPLKFREASRTGVSFFEMALDTDQQAAKQQVLSEGEQRALSLACFLAESHVAGRSSAVILDDPVTSMDHLRIQRVAARLAREAATGRQIIIFTHNLLFYQEIMRACASANPPVPVLPCLIQKSSTNEFGLVTVDDQPWVAKRVKERIRHLDETLKAIPDDLPRDSDSYRSAAKNFYTDLRETWERAVEEVVFNDVVQRFGQGVSTMRLRGVAVSDDDYRIVFFGMKKASEYSGHDRAAARQLGMPSKDEMRSDLHEITAFRATRQKAIDERAKIPAALEEPPRAAMA